ncbi:hypothetical protein QE361_003642 [Sphingomonas sp. SORGH_AS802]|uniref:hypothetical protein n=1 Tax=unclassified Sphingomonas TaxID=196159 RepID=UPI0028580CF4|nr:MULTISPECIES: hypothetical protein [unclassified Sphingomonas]MDR6125941.1 hypothetical protein [Sphingomonas sp. SORGH_AS_0438]MDR6136634.1 hypothetical protein [Sphingomonas sp. SORGH_AS_0802]
MKTATLSIWLVVAACSYTKPDTFDLSGAKAQRAVTIASDYAVDHFGAPACRDTDANWRYILRQDGDMLIADIGPKNAPNPAIQIVMRATDLEIIKAVKA